MGYTAKILIVDDSMENRIVLDELVQLLGHTSILATDGVVAIEQIKHQLPDLILLDLNMPKMNGYELLKYLKNNLPLAHIPVIMISAFDNVDNVVNCIKQGADDYLSKPFNSTLLKARINACLVKKEWHDHKEHYRQLLEDYNMNLEKHVREKTKELAEAHEKLTVLDKAKSDFLRLISHELRTPLNSLIGPMALLSEGELDETSLQEIKEMLKISFDRLLDIVEQAELLTKIDVLGDIQFSLSPYPVSYILETAIQQVGNFAQLRKVSFAALPECEIQIFCEANLLTQALSELLKTAIKFSNKNGTVTLSFQSEENEVHIGIHTTGWTIPEEFMDKFFEVFSIVEPITPGGDLGLAPPVAERIITLFGGSVTVKNRESAGVSFEVNLERVDDNASAGH